MLIALGTDAAHHAQIPLWGGSAKDAHDYARSGSPATVGQVDFNYPALEQEHPGRDNGGWAEVKVFYAVVVDPAQARVAARLTDGTPLLLEKQMGEGHLLLLASGLENLTNDLPLHPVFVAFVDRTARYLSGSERLSGSRLVDSFVALRAAADPAGSVANVEVIDPDGHRPLSLSEARTVESFRLQRAGYYQIRFADGRDAVIGVNPDRRESDLEPMAPGCATTLERKLRRRGGADGRRRAGGRKDPARKPMVVRYAACIGCRIGGDSLLTCRKPHNMDELLHRGQYAVEGDEPPVPIRKRFSLYNLVGITDQFTRSDRWVALGIFGWGVIWFLVFGVPSRGCGCWA